MHFIAPLGIGQVHLFHELFRQNPVAATILLVILVAAAFYFNRR